MRNIHRLRESPPDAEALRALNQNMLALLCALCEAHQKAAHEDSRKLAFKFLNDWEAIVRVIETPAHPLTNNLAKRSLRHWVIAAQNHFRLADGPRESRGRLAGERDRYRALKRTESLGVYCSGTGRTP